MKRAGMQVKFAGESCHSGGECIVLVGAGIFHVPQDRRADRDAVDAKLVGAPGQRRQFQPGQLLPGMIERAVVGDGAGRFLVVALRHLGALAARPADAPERQVDTALRRDGRPATIAQ